MDRCCCFTILIRYINIISMVNLSCCMNVQHFNDRDQPFAHQILCQNIRNRSYFIRIVMSYVVRNSIRSSVIFKRCDVQSQIHIQLEIETVVSPHYIDIPRLRSETVFNATHSKLLPHETKDSSERRTSTFSNNVRYSKYFFSSFRSSSSVASCLKNNYNLRNYVVIISFCIF